MKLETIPLMPLPYTKLTKLIIRGFYPLSSLLLKLFPSMDKELSEADSRLTAKDYMGGALLSFAIYFVIIGSIFSMWAYRNDLISDLNTRLTILGVSLSISAFIFLYILLIPKWQVNKKKREVERNLLFAVRHLMIQTNAGVPLFDSLTSISEEYGDERMDYGEISREFKKIVKEVKSGKELTVALEESASKNPSMYYRRIMWQLSNANKSGANIGAVLKDTVEYLSNEQRIMIRDYGSQLSPLALFYMLTCIISPTMGLVILMIMSSFVNVPLNEMTVVVISLLLLVIQIMFIGLIKSRRPTVAL